MSVKTKTPTVKCPPCKKVLTKKNCILCDLCENWFHLKCTKLLKKDFDKHCDNETLPFICLYCQNFPCGKCKLPVFNHNHAIFCESHCANWYHLKCTKVTLSQYNILKTSPEPWICGSCIAFPFSSLNDNELVLEYSPDILFDIDTYPDRCSTCCRKIVQNKKKKALPCKTCHLLVHRKCTDMPLSTLNSLNKKELFNWECKKCLSEKFPFVSLDAKGIIELSFNSNFDCPCRVSSRPTFEKQKYRLNYKSPRETDNKQYGPDPNNELDKELLTVNFDYYEDHEFHKMVTLLPNAGKHFSIYHTNIECLSSKLDKLQLAITNSGFMFDVIALTETWNDKKRLNLVDTCCMEGYSKFLFTPGNSLKGGCGFYVSNSIKVIERKEYDISHQDDKNEYEAKWIELVGKNGRNIILGVAYRHPKKMSDNSFTVYLGETLDKIRKKNKLTFLVGDFNYDLLSTEKDKYAKEFLDNMILRRFQPCILEPTRILPNNRPTLIDNIFINTLEKKVISGNLLSKLSDHLPNFTILCDIFDKTAKRKRTIRDFTHFNVANYNNDIANISLQIPSPTVDKLFNHLNKELVTIINKHAPLKTLSVNKCKWSCKPWINKSIQDKIQAKNMYYAKYKRTGNIFWYDRHKNLCKEVKKVIFVAKKEYFKQYFATNLDNVRKLWQCINECLLNRHKSFDQIFLNDNGEIITDHKTITNKFNQYFTSIAHKLVEKIGKPNNKFQDYLKNPNKHSIYLNEIEPDKVLNILSTHFFL